MAAGNWKGSFRNTNFFSFHVKLVLSLNELKNFNLHLNFINHANLILVYHLIRTTIAINISNPLVFSNQIPSQWIRSIQFEQRVNKWDQNEYMDYRLAENYDSPKQLFTGNKRVERYREGKIIYIYLIPRVNQFYYFFAKV